MKSTQRYRVQAPEAPALHLSPQEIIDLAGEDKRIAFVSGNFNVVHPGHLRLFRFAAENADFLVVGINPDEAPGVTMPAEARLDGVRSIAMVGCASLLQETPESFIRALQPAIVVKGKEYEYQENSEADAVATYGGKLLFSSGEVRFSSLGLLQREYFEANLSTIKKSYDYPERHAFKVQDLARGLDALAGKKVVVIGDLIVDTYINCDPLGMSQEDPTIVVTPIDQKTFVGGAGIVAAHACGLGAQVSFLTVVGNDESKHFAEKALTGYGVNVEMLEDLTRPTTHKQRYRASGKTLLRVNHLRQHPIVPELARGLVDRAAAFLNDADLLLFADFNYGCLPQPVVDELVEKCKKRDIMMAADSQASSQLSDISRFKNMDLITPTEREARLAVQDFESGLVVVAERLQNISGARNIVVTLGAEGMLLHVGEKGTFVTDRLPAFNTAPKDVAGAGDSLFTCTSLAMRAGLDVWRSVYLGNVAAACQVSRVGNMPLSRRDLVSEILRRD